ncbi:hypothetical protein [Larkinella rosea]|uniref:DUF4369 domain-containing protein n=1 Tax=Larkinella rosea TaxID=2025312 RepID=A0A3P1C3X2_9BACT|nr:hypothetical protein [Larkinella rosea]RRB07736.1 hypothetical protein EHT25_08170 [Larkinella rosea]
MKYRSALLSGLVTLLSSVAHSQCVVSQDAKNRVITTCQFYAPKNGLLVNRPDRSQALTQVTFLGSEYLTYPIWQDGTLESGDPKKPIPCQIAFNIATNVVKCRFEGDEQEYEVQPEAFTIHDMRFTSQLRDKGSKTSRVYYMVLYAGKTRLLKQIRSNLSVVKRDAYSLEQSFDGTFINSKTYFIQRNNERLRVVNLSRKSVLGVLKDPTSQLDNYITQRKLDVNQLVDVVAYYDGFQK